MRVTKNVSRKKRIVCGSIVFLFYVVACSSSKDIVRLMAEKKNEFQKENVRTLQDIGNTDLRTARDDDSGTLYYTGLLLYFNGRKEAAEIAFRRVAKTGREPWATESARLVAYFMILNSRYNQLAPFLEESYEDDIPSQDPELFYYHSFALYLTKEYEKLSALVEGPLPQWNDTLRNRVSKQHASFYYEFWKALLSEVPLQGKKTDSLLSVLLKYPARSISGNIKELIEKRYPRIPASIREIVRVKNAIRKGAKQRFDLLLALPEDILSQEGILKDIIDQLGENKAYESRIHSVLESLYEKVDKTQQMAIDMARADVAYQRQNYGKSYRYYKKILKRFTQLLSPEQREVVLWRILRSGIYAHPHNFLSDFSIARNDNAVSGGFSHILEEYLSFLLRKKRYNTAKNDLAYFEQLRDDAHMRTALDHWKFVLSRIDIASTENEMPRQKRISYYRSSSPYAALIRGAHADVDEFVDAWKGEKTRDAAPSFVGNFIEGYFSFGLYEYARTVIIENFYRINQYDIRNAVDTFFAVGKEREAFALLRRASTSFVSFPEKKEDIYALYPRIFQDIVDGLTDNDKERAIVFAIMREESGFVADIRSPADAVGAMQLLAKTADDIAQRIRYGKFSLTNAKDNISLGYQYYFYLRRVVGSHFGAILAYNAGLGNFWKWEKEIFTEDPVVFAEKVPFRETRKYVRRVVSSAFIYALLYYDISPKEMQAYMMRQ